MCVLPSLPTYRHLVGRKKTLNAVTLAMELYNQIPENSSLRIPQDPYHYKTNSLIISQIIRLELVVRTIGLIVRTIRLLVRTTSSPWDPGG